MVRKGKDDALFFCCWILNKVAYETNNHLDNVVNNLKPGFLKRLYDYSDVFHCENPDRMSYEIIERNGLVEGDFIRQNPPSWTEICYVYHNLVYDLHAERFYGDKDILEVFKLVLNHPIGQALENYRNCLYWQSAECIYECYVQNDLHVMD